MLDLSGVKTVAKSLIFLMLAFLFILFKYLGFFEPIELGIYDQFWQLAPLERPDPRIIIVGIDEEDIRELLGEWSPSDDQLAEMIDRVEAQKPTVIGLDIFRDLEVTGRLREIFEKSETLVGVGVHRQINFPPLLRARFQVGDVGIEDERLRNYVRRIPLYRVIDGTPDSRISHVSLKLAKMWLRKHSESFKEQAHPKTYDLMINDQVIRPLPRWAGGYSKDTGVNYQMLVRWRKGSYSQTNWEQSFKVVTLRQIEEGQIAPNLFTDKIVLIGARADSLKDQLITPIGDRYGVDTIAHETSQIISYVKDDRPFFRFAPEGVEYGLILFMIAVVYVHDRYLRFERIWWELGVHCVIALTVVALIYSLGYGAFLRAWWIPIGQLLIAYVVSLLSFIIVKYVQILQKANEKKAQLIKEKDEALERQRQELNRLHEARLIEENQKTLGEFAVDMLHELNQCIGILSEGHSAIQELTRNETTLAAWLSSQEEDIHFLLDLLDTERVETLKENLDYQEYAIVKLRESFRDLRSIYEGSKDKNSSFRVGQQIDELLQVYEPVFIKNHIKIKSEKKGVVGDLFFPQTVFKRMLNHLIDNALDALQENKEGRAKKIKIIIEENEQWLTLKIQDTGSGMAEDIRGKVFDPFFTTKKDGMGWGLHFCYQQMLRYHGKITVETGLDEGSTFTLWFNPNK